jgi:hypothetical protein
MAGLSLVNFVPNARRTAGITPGIAHALMHPGEAAKSARARPEEDP